MFTKITQLNSNIVELGIFRMKYYLENCRKGKPVRNIYILLIENTSKK